MGSTRPVAARLSCPTYFQPRPRRHYKSFHTTSSRSAKSRSPYRSISKAELDRIEQAKTRIYSRYTKDELTELESKYTPQQLASITAAEEAIDLEDLSRAKPRRDVLRPKVIDSKSYARIQPTIDKSIERLRGEWDNTFDNSKLRHHRAVPDAEKQMERIFEILADPVENPLDEIDERRKLVSKAELKGIDPPNPIHTKPKANVLVKLLDLMDSPRDQKEARALNRKSIRQVLDEVDDSGPWTGQLSLSDEKIRELQDASGFIGPWTDLLSMSDEELRDLVDKSDEKREQFKRDMRDVPLRNPPTLSTRQRLERVLNWRNSTPEVAPEIPRINDPRVMWESAAETEAAEQTGAGDDETVEAIARLSKVTGQQVEHLRRYRTKSLVSHRVVNQTRLGKIASQYVLAVAGDERGMVGLGEGKAADMEVAMRQANLNAIRNMRPVHRYEGRTIFGELQAKCGAAELTLSAAPPGFGLRCSSRIFEIARAAGLQDLSAKVHRSRNPMNVAKAVWQALCDQRHPDEIARGRGLKLVDVRKVYYAGNI